MNELNVLFSGFAILKNYGKGMPKNQHTKEAI